MQDGSFRNPSLPSLCIWAQSLCRAFAPIVLRGTGRKHACKSRHKAARACTRAIMCLPASYQPGRSMLYFKAAHTKSVFDTHPFFRAIPWAKLQFGPAVPCTLHLTTPLSPCRGQESGGSYCRDCGPSACPSAVHLLLLLRLLHTIACGHRRQVPFLGLDCNMPSLGYKGGPFPAAAGCQQGYNATF